MILSNTEIHLALDNRRLVIEPEPFPRFLDASGLCPYQTSSVDLRLGSEISYFKEGLPINVDLRRGSFANLFGPNSEHRVITEEQPFALKPGKQVLGKTLEKITLAEGGQDDVVSEPGAIPRPDPSWWASLIQSLSYVQNAVRSPKRTNEEKSGPSSSTAKLMS